MNEIKYLQFSLSPLDNRKYRAYVELNNGEILTIDFGDSRYEHYRTSRKIPKHLHIYKEHHNLTRRNNYLTRATAIKNKKGELTYSNPRYANFYSVNYLWK